MAPTHHLRHHRSLSQKPYSLVPDAVMLDIDANKLSPQQRSRVLGELFGPRVLSGKSAFAGIFGDTQNAVDRKYLAGRSRHITFEDREFVIKPSASIFRGLRSGKFELKLLFFSKRDNHMVLHLSPPLNCSSYSSKSIQAVRIPNHVLTPTR